MAERQAIIETIENGQIKLRLTSKQCSDCTLGCGGRCNVFAGDDSPRFSSALLDHPIIDQSSMIGRQVRLVIDDQALMRNAFLGYGVALLGLVLGAGIGYALGVWRDSQNFFTLIGACVGTFLAITLSKRRAMDSDKNIRIMFSDSENLD